MDDVNANPKSKIRNPKSKMDASCINYKDTGFFSQTVIDYLDDKPELRPFYSYRPDLEGFKALLKNKKVIADRELLAEVLNRTISIKFSKLEYSSNSKSVQDNIDSA